MKFLLSKVVLFVLASAAVLEQGEALPPGLVKRTYVVPGEVGREGCVNAKDKAIEVDTGEHVTVCEILEYTGTDPVNITLRDLKGLQNPTQHGGNRTRDLTTVDGNSTYYYDEDDENWLALSWWYSDMVENCDCGEQQIQFNPGDWFCFWRFYQFYKHFFGCVDLPDDYTCGDDPVEVNLRNGEKNPGVQGDPHFKTWHGEKFDYHGACDLVLLSSPSFRGGKGLDIHIRTKHRYQFSFIYSVAIRIGDDIFEVDGKKDDIHFLNGNGNAELPAKVGGSRVTHKRDSAKQHTYFIALEGHSRVVIRVFKDYIAVLVKGATEEVFGDSVGLMGNYVTGAKLGRDGTTVFDNADEFGEEWQVLESEPKLFHTIEGVQHPMKCLAPPAVDIERRRNLRGDPKNEAAAKKACAHVDKEDFENCVFDVMVTDDPDVAGSY